MMTRHMTIEQLPYRKPVQRWLQDRYGETEANQIWEQTQENYRNHLQDLPDSDGSKNGHARSIYDGLLLLPRGFAACFDSTISLTKKER